MISGALYEESARMGNRQWLSGQDLRSIKLRDPNIWIPCRCVGLLAINAT